MKRFKVRNFFALAIYTGAMELYFYEWFYGKWDWVYSKLFYGLTTFSLLCWLIIDEITPKSSSENYELKLINLASLAINAILCSLISADIINNGRTCLFLFNGFVFVTTIFILIGGFRHGAFKD